jgi:hypothetical protein
MCPQSVREEKKIMLCSWLRDIPPVVLSIVWFSVINTSLKNGVHWSCMGGSGTIVWYIGAAGVPMAVPAFCS